MALGLLLTPLVLEAALRGLARIARDDRGGRAGASLAVCQGDSYTHGLFVPADLAYPARLEAHLAQGGAPAPRVVNLGVPGKPTWEVRRELRRDLQAYRPRFVLLLAGVNDRWQRRPADHDVEHAAPRSEWRIARTWQLLAHRFADDASPTAAGPVRLGPGHARVLRRDREGVLRPFEVLRSEEENDVQAWIEEDMASAVATAREEGVEPVLLGYPSLGEPFDELTEVLRSVAASTGTPFVDFRPAVAAALERVPAELLFFEDRHARPLGCDLMARVLVHRLHELGLVEVERLPEILGGLPAGPAPALRVEPHGTGPVEAVTVRYRAGCSAVLLVSGSRGETAVEVRDGALVAAREGRELRLVPLAADPLLERTLERDGARPVPLDTTGAARLDVPRRLRPDGDGQSVFACVVVLAPDSASIETVSEVLELPLR